MRLVDLNLFLENLLMPIPKKKKLINYVTFKKFDINPYIKKDSSRKSSAKKFDIGLLKKKTLK
jgi:hypothetical protein